MRKDDANRLRHMRDAAREALEFGRGRVRSDLDTDRVLVLALIKDIEIIKAKKDCWSGASELVNGGD